MQRTSTIIKSVFQVITLVHLTTKFLENRTLLSKAYCRATKHMPCTLCARLCARGLFYWNFFKHYRLVESNHGFIPQLLCDHASLHYFKNLEVLHRNVGYRFHSFMKIILQYINTFGMTNLFSDESTSPPFFPVLYGALRASLYSRFMHLISEDI